MRWFEASPSRATPKGQNLHLPYSIATKQKFLHIPALSRSGHNNATKPSLIMVLACGFVRVGRRVRGVWRGSAGLPVPRRAGVVGSVVGWQRRVLPVLGGRCGRLDG